MEDLRASSDISVEDFFATIAKYLSQEQVAFVRKAYNLAADAHAGSKPGIYTALWGSFVYLVISVWEQGLFLFRLTADF